MTSLNLRGILLLLTLQWSQQTRLSEDERIKQWYERGNVWPPTWQNETEEMKAVLAQREQDIMNIPYSLERWENWLQFTQQRMVPKLTPVGFQVIEIPAEISEKLIAAAHEGIDKYDSLPLEGQIDVIYANEGMRPRMVNMWGEAMDAHKALTGLHEEWAGGIKLRPTSVYGLRLYQNGSSLVMHYDRVETHVISSIVHLAHLYDDDNDPWPIQIEDHNGKLHSVNLAPGEMLFYESAKCLHGRMKKFRGKYYGSLFMHYQPVDESIWNFGHEQVINNVPPHWSENIQFEGRGPRYAGACITTPDRSAAGAPTLKIEREEHTDDSDAADL